MLWILMLETSIFKVCGAVIRNALDFDVFVGWKRVVFYPHHQETSLLHHPHFVSNGLLVVTTSIVASNGIVWRDFDLGEFGMWEWSTGRSVAS